MKAVSISSIRLDPVTQLRAEINPDVITEYAHAMRAGESFPPVDLFEDGRDFYVGDGFHRVKARIELGEKTVMANIHAGGRKEALKFAASANARHGLRRTVADKRRAIEVMLQEFPSLSDRGVAQLCAASHPTVARIRAELVNLPVARIGLDGRTRHLPAAQAFNSSAWKAETSEKLRALIGEVPLDLRQEASKWIDATLAELTAA